MKNTTNLDHCATILARIGQLGREINEARDEIAAKSDYIIKEMGVATAGTIDGRKVCIVAEYHLATHSQKILILLPEE
jgi:hypothetical protein